MPTSSFHREFEITKKETVDRLEEYVKGEEKLKQTIETLQETIRRMSESDSQGTGRSCELFSLRPQESIYKPPGENCGNCQNWANKCKREDEL